LKKIHCKVAELMAYLFIRGEIELVSLNYKRTIVQRAIPDGTVLHLRSYSVINDPAMLALLKKICYGKHDIRAGWVGPGVPATDSLEFKPLAKWALCHWSMYSGFLPQVRQMHDGGQILDVGCGTGHATICLSTILPGYTVTGIDMDDIAIRFAERFNKTRNVRYIHYDFLNFPSTQRYTYIFSLEILEHIPSTRHYEFVDKCLSMLQNEGLLFLTTPNALDEPDSSYGHVGLLNRVRARAFIERYKDRIVDASFYDNQKLMSTDAKEFILQDPVDMFEDTGRNRSHFRLAMR